MPWLELFLGRKLIRGSYASLLAGGAALGVAGALTVLALFNNYYRATVRMLVGAHPHLLVSSDRKLDERDLASIRMALAALVGDGVEISQPALHLRLPLRVEVVRRLRVPCFTGTRQACADPGLLPPPDVPYRSAWVESGSRSGLVDLRGVTVTGRTTVAQIEHVLAAAQGLDRLGRGDPPACILEDTLVPGLVFHDDLLITGPGARDLHVMALGTLGLGLGSGEVPLMLTSLELAQRLAGRPGEINALEVRLSDAEAAPRLAALLRNRFGTAHRVTSWAEQAGGAHELLAVLRAVIFLVSFSVVVVAALAVISTLSLIVAENAARIAILRSMGLRDRTIYRVFALRCTGIAAVGLAVGLAVGCGATEVLLRQEGVRDALARMGVADPALLVRGVDVALLVLGTILTFVVTALVPARHACRVDVVRGLQS